MEIADIETECEGSVTGRCLSELDNEATCIDRDQGSLSKGCGGNIWIYEPGPAELVG